MPIKQTPLVAQYLNIKRQVPDAILFFRLGDFYEMFFEDAEVGARILDIQLTSRSKDGVPLCGVPYHAAEAYIARLLKAGLKVAICEQSGDGAAAGSSAKGGVFQLTAPAASGGRGLMARSIVRVITPGTVGEELVLVADEKNFLLAIAPEGSGFALAALDVSTGESIVTSVGTIAAARDEIARLTPREIIAPKEDADLDRLLQTLRCPTTRLAGPSFQADMGVALNERFGTAAESLNQAQTTAFTAAVTYAEENFGGRLGHLQPPQIHRPTQFMLLDETTRTHLELTISSDGTRAGSLLSVLDHTLTPIGARKLASWITYPLTELAGIRRRHDAVDELLECDLGGSVAEALKQIGDLERLAGRIGSLRASPRDALKLGQALSAVARLKDWVIARHDPGLRAIAAQLNAYPELARLIDTTISEEPPVNPRDGNTIRRGFSAEVDELRALALDARSVIARMEAAERERTKIPSLKIRYNQVFGYYIEVTRPHLERVPAEYERKQTLVGGERFTTAELKELERKILGAENGLRELEQQIFVKLLRDLAMNAQGLLETAAAVGDFDVLMSLASVARRRGYVRPQMNTDLAIHIRDGRHPVLEAGMKPGEFVPNDFEADPDIRQLLLITGPNMAGKSTYLRQVALIVIMAQIGSFVPATEARLGITDRVLTRIGARDELRRGESTFMVEMRETARLLEGLTERSLLLLDEVGRGTSTFDGLAIAWAIAEYLHDSTRAKVLFATHFHELIELARDRSRVKNLSMAVRAWGEEVLFLRSVVEEPANRSYGIEVARLAGLPAGVIARAREILDGLQSGHRDGSISRAGRTAATASGSTQMNLFAQAAGLVVNELQVLDLERLTPLDALNLLARWVAQLRARE